MKKRMALTLIFAASIAFTTPIKADESRSQLHKTLFFDLAINNDNSVKGKEINRRLRSKLKELPNLEIVKESDPCPSEQYAETALKENGAHRALYGFLSVKTDTERKRMGKTGTDKYIIKLVKHYTYRIQITLVDVESGKLTDISREAKPEELDRTIDEMAASLAKYFEPRKLPEQPKKEPPVTETPVTVKAPEPTIAPTGKKEEPKPVAPEPVKTPAAKEEKNPTEYEVAAYFSFIKPVGSFANVTKFALGNVVEGRRKNLFMENSELRMGLGYYYLSSAANDVKSYRSFIFLVSGGYRFTDMFLNGLTITPLFGIGYQYHMLTNKNYSGTKGYLDPLVSIKCGADYKLTDKFSATAAAGYSVFFESDSTGMYPVLDLGLKYNF